MQLREHTTQSSNVLVIGSGGSGLRAAIAVLEEAKEKLSRLKVVWVDQGYCGERFAETVKQLCGEQVNVEVIKRHSKEFEVLPKRWIVERTFLAQSISSFKQGL